MKLKYDFEIVDMGDEICAVPVGDNAEDFHGVLQLNDVAAKMLTYIKEYDTPEEAFAKLQEDYPEDEKLDIANKFCDFLNQITHEGFLLP